MIVRGRMVKTDTSKSYAKNVGKMCLGMKPLDGDLEVYILWFRQRKAGDIDSRQKAILDSLNGFAYHDDRQVKKLIIEIDDTQKHNPRCFVRIKPIQNPRGTL